MKKLGFIFGLMLLGTVGAEAVVLTPAEALARVRNSKQTGKIKVLKDNDFRLARTSEVNGEPAVYVFDHGEGAKGFFLVSADDAVPALLGYSDDAVAGSNPAFEYWIEEYGRQIEWARSHGARYSASELKDTRAAIPPLCTTKWNQDAPYNDLCPEMEGRHSVTGCTATALAQVMKYHNWPPRGEGVYSYKSEGFTTDISLDFSNVEFDWSKMLDSYNDTATDQERNAVATLMYACGVASDMQYSPEASGAYTSSAARGLMRNLRYDSGVLNVSRDFYGLEEWNDFIYSQLTDYGPVEYSGHGVAGHAFVCDGYAGNNYFHINWGWGGMSDGYFLLTALDPLSQGIGGSTAGFNFWQEVICNIKPRSGDASGEVIPYFLAESFVITPLDVDDDQDFYTFGLQVSGFTYNASLSPLTGFYGLRLEDALGNVTYLEGSPFEELPEGYGYTDWYAGSVENLKALADGIYCVSPVVNVNGKWFPVRVRTGAPTTTEIHRGTFSVSASKPEQATLSIGNIEMLTPFYAGKPFRVSLQARNAGSLEYIGGIKMVLSKAFGSSVAEAQLCPVDIPGGATSEIIYQGTFSSDEAELAAGTYYVSFENLEGVRLTNRMKINLNVAEQTVIEAYDLRMPGGTLNVDPNRLEFEVDVKCVEGYYTDALELPIWHGADMVAELYADFFAIAEGETTTLHFAGKIDNPDYGGSYSTMLFNHQNWDYLGNSIQFTLEKVAGAQDAGLSAEILHTKYYSVDGHSYDQLPQAAGVYIERRTKSDGSIETKKIMVK